jgi:hypothetical protein
VVGCHSPGGYAEYTETTTTYYRPLDWEPGDDLATIESEDSSDSKAEEKTHQPDKERIKKVVEHKVKVQQPPDSVKPATIEKTSKDGQNHVTASTGSEQAKDHTMLAITNKATWFGIALIGTGVAMLVLRLWIPIIPIFLPIVLGAIGAGMFFLPVLIDRYAWIVMLLLVGAVIWAGIEVFNNWDLLSRDPETKKRKKKKDGDSPP